MLAGTRIGRGKTVFPYIYLYARPPQKTENQDSVQLHRFSLVRWNRGHITVNKPLLWVGIPSSLPQRFSLPFTSTSMPNARDNSDINHSTPTSDLVGRRTLTTTKRREEKKSTKSNTLQQAPNTLQQLLRYTTVRREVRLAHAVRLSFFFFNVLLTQPLCSLFKV